MTDKEFIEQYKDVFLFLEQKSIYELRSYGRAFGVKSPSSLKKRELIFSIIRIGAGIETAPAKSVRGARPKMPDIASEDIERLNALFVCRE